LEETVDEDEGEVDEVANVVPDAHGRDGQQQQWFYWRGERRENGMKQHLRIINEM